MYIGTLEGEDFSAKYPSIIVLQVEVGRLEDRLYKAKQMKLLTYGHLWFCIHSIGYSSGTRFTLKDCQKFLG
jgi:hypothetical protein